MINSHTIIGFLSTMLLLQACNAGPDTPRPVTQTPQSTVSPQASSNTAARDGEYIGKLQNLLQRNPEMEAQQAMARGERILMGYYAGRAGLKFPGLSPEQQSNQTCTLKTLDGLGDVIYGNDHLKYRVELRKFAGRYNIAMMPVCL